MASAAEDSTGYGGGAGGKFRKNSRRPQTTPYDRPPTAHRNGGRTTGWLSRIVDPASKLISVSAHKLFSSVLRKRLLPPPVLQPSPDNGVDPPENHLGDVMTDDPPRIQERDKNAGNTYNSGSVTDGVAELEHILKQKMFTRSEIDRLTVLLQSRTVDKSGIVSQKRLESRPCEPPTGHSWQDELDGAVCENKASPSEETQTDSTPAVRLKVNHDDDIASPAELAKTYMGNRSRIGSPSMLARRNQAVREETNTLTALQSHRADVPVVQKPFSTPGTSQNDFVIPRSRGRSALYSMARTPYSRGLPTEDKGVGTSNGAFAGQSLLTSQKVIKRRCSALENDIGAVGPIRRIREKHNLLYSKSLGQSSSRSPLTLTTSEVGEASLYNSSKLQEDRGDKSKPVSSLHTSSKSIEMGQRILQQLEKMTPSKEKSSETKLRFSGGISSMELTPAILHGQTRKNFETVNPLKYGQNGLVCGKVVDSSNKVHHENGDARVTDNDVMAVAKNAASVVLKSVFDVPKKSQALQMSAYEDQLELHDGARSNEIVSPLINEGKRSLEASSMKSNGNLLPEIPPLPRANKADKPLFPESQLPNSEFSNSAGATDAGIKLPGSNNKCTEAVDLLKKSGVSATRVGVDATDCATVPISGSNNNLTSSADFPSFQSGLPFKGSSISSDPIAMVSSDTDTAGKSKVTTFGNSASRSLPGAASAATSSFTTASSRFGASTNSCTNNQFQAPCDVSSRSIFGDLILRSKISPTFTTESMPSQAAATAFTAASGSSGLAVSCDVNQSSSSGFSSMATSGSTNNASTNIFGGNWKPNNSPVCASASTHFSSVSSGLALGANSISAPANVSSAGNSFGTSSASTPFSSGTSVFAFKTTSVPAPANGSSAGVPFGAFSTSAAVGSTSSVFTFGASSSASTTPASINLFASAASVLASNNARASQPAFGNGSSIFAFGSTASPNNHMNEDSMAEDSMQPSAITTQTSGFGQSLTRNTPFGMAPTPVPPGANPFQFSSQQNQPTPPHNPFQTSSNSNGGGGFSLGAGGGNDKSKRKIIKVKNRIKK